MGSSYLLVTSQPNSRAFFRYASRCVVELEDARRVIADGADGIQRTGGGRGGRGDHSAPTESAAIFRITVADARVAEAERVAADCEAVIQAAHTLTVGIGKLLGEHVGEVMRRHYIGRESVREVAEGRGVSVRTVNYWIGKGCDLADDDPRLLMDIGARYA